MRCVVKGWHRFNPFGEVVYGNNDVLVIITRCKVSFRKFNPPFIKGDSIDDGMQRSGWCSCFGGKKLSIHALLNNINEIK
jgi:hypothetical protein